MADPPDPVVYHVPEAFEHFYEREYHSLVSLGYALTGSWAAAEDLAQEAFLAAHQGLAAHQPVRTADARVPW